MIKDRLKESVVEARRKYELTFGVPIDEFELTLVVSGLVYEARQEWLKRWFRQWDIADLVRVNNTLLEEARVYREVGRGVVEDEKVISLKEKRRGRPKKAEAKP